MDLENQLSILEWFLKNQITSDYVYIDIPGHYNVGDHLIYSGAMCILKRVTSYKCRYQTIAENFDGTKISDSVIILLHGGGNWGDGFYTPFRTKIVKSFPNNKIIFMPQTIRYNSLQDLENDARVYSEHPNIHLCARDLASFEILNKYFYTNHIYLLPDSAIGLYGTLPKRTRSNTKDILYIKRKDSEASLKEWHNNTGVVKDWDSILNDLYFFRLSLPYRFIRKLKRITKSKWLKMIANSYFVHVIEPWFMNNIPLYFLRFDKVLTTRLHGLLLAKLLEIPVEWQDTRFKKISNYYYTWFND